MIFVGDKSIGRGPKNAQLSRSRNWKLVHKNRGKIDRNNAMKEGDLFQRLHFLPQIPRFSCLIVLKLKHMTCDSFIYNLYFKRFPKLLKLTI